MELREPLLYHQIHPLKLATDLSAGVCSAVLLRQRRPRVALLVHVVPPIIASTVLLYWADLEQQRRSAMGRYIARAMTGPMDALRLAGDIVIDDGGLASPSSAAHSWPAGHPLCLGARRA